MIAGVSLMGGLVVFLIRKADPHPGDETPPEPTAVDVDSQPKA